MLINEVYIFFILNVRNLLQQFINWNLTDHHYINVSLPSFALSLVGDAIVHFHLKVNQQ